MIDIENRVYTAVREAVKARLTNISSTRNAMVQALPAMEFYEVGNSVYTPSITLERRENHAVVSFECNIYSHEKQEAKEIAGLVDDCMAGMGFTRTLKTPTPNIDRTIYRLTMRWEGVVSRGMDKGAYTEHLVYAR